MTTTPNQPEPAKAKTVQPPPAPRPEPEMRRPSRVGRFFSRLTMLAIFCAVSFVGGYYVMDQEARLHRDVLVQEQVAAEDRIAALEEQIREMQLSRMQENSVEIDLTEVFAPIREAVSRLAEAQMTIVARQISAEIAQRVDVDVQNLNTSAPLAAIAETAAAALTPALAGMPPSEGKAEAPPEPVAELAPAEPPGGPATEPAASEPGGGPAPDGGQVAPGDDAAEESAAGEQRPVAELSGRTPGGRLPTAGAAGDRFPSRVPQWLSRLADSLESARSRLDTATAAPGVGGPAQPAPHRFGG